MKKQWKTKKKKPKVKTKEKKRVKKPIVRIMQIKECKLVENSAPLPITNAICFLSELWMG